MFVSVDSAALSHELYMDRSQLVKKLNADAGKSILNEIIIK